MKRSSLIFLFFCLIQISSSLAQEEVPSAIPRRRWFKKIPRAERELREKDAKNRYLLKGGPSLAGIQYSTYSTHDNHTGLGFNTHAGRLFRQVELNLSSYGTVARFRGLGFNVQNSQLAHSSGLSTTIAFGPTFKYITNYLFNHWRLYVLGGALYGQQAYRVKASTVSSGPFVPEKKICVEGPGYIVGVGIDEINTFYRHKIYLDLTYKHLQGDKVVVTQGNQILQTAVWQGTASHKIKERSFMANVGFYFF